MIGCQAGCFTREHARATSVEAQTHGGVLNDITALHVQPGQAIAALVQANRAHGDQTRVEHRIA